MAVPPGRWTPDHRRPALADRAPGRASLGRASVSTALGRMHFAAAALHGGLGTVYQPPAHAAGRPGWHVGLLFTGNRDSRREDADMMLIDMTAELSSLMIGLNVLMVVAGAAVLASARKSRSVSSASQPVTNRKWRSLVLRPARPLRRKTRQVTPRFPRRLDRERQRIRRAAPPAPRLSGRGHPDVLGRFFFSFRPAPAATSAAPGAPRRSDPMRRRRPRR